MSALRGRGLAPSIGAGGSLVVAALLCLLFASALLTFDGWPGADEGRPDGSLSLRAPEAKAAGRSASGPVAAGATAPAPAAGGSSATDARRRAAGRPPVAGTTPPSFPAPVDAPAGAPQATGPGSSAAAPAGAAAPAPAQQAPAPAPGPVETVVGTGRGLVDQVRRPLPPLPVPVEQPVQQTLDSVEDVAGTVDDVPGRLLPQPLP